MTSRPSLAELRLRVFKHSGTHTPEVGNVLARFVGRPSAVYGTWLAIRLGVAADAVTLASLVANLAAAASICSGSRLGFSGGVGLLWIGYWLDHVDGQVARWRGTASLDGVYLDYLMHHASTMALGFALGFGLSMKTGFIGWTAAGFVVAMGWTFLSLHNDCRYKAFFQRLKRESASYRVDCGSGGRPSPPLPWPRSGRGVILWPLQKACEPHVVLLGLTALACLAPLARAPWLWLWLWKSLVVAMALLAPSLAAARVWRAIRVGSTESEYRRWFRPDRDDATADVR